MEIKRYNFQTRIYESREEMGRAAADAVAQAVCRRMETQPFVRMIFAAAPSQNEFLKYFAQDSRVDFSRIIAFHMDEYVGLSPDAPQGFGNFLRTRLFDIAPFHAVHYINGNAGDLQAECARYAALLAEAPIDIVCMGIGENGHIAFNDPHVADLRDPKAVKTVHLDGVCRMQQVHDGCFAEIESVPETAITLTVPRLCDAKQHFCIVPAHTKREAVYKTLHGAVGNHCPATALRLCPEVALFLDSDSASML